MTNIEDAYRKYSTERFPLPREPQLARLEQRIGIVFPEAYRRFALEFNGGYFDEPGITPVGEDCPEETLECLFGIGASHPVAELGTPATLALFDGNDPPLIVPIGATGTGGLIILDTAPGEGRGNILLKQAFGSFYFLAEDLEEFFGLLCEPTYG